MIGTNVMTKSAEEHREFHHGLERYHEYLVSLAGREQNFDGKALVEIVDVFSAVLMKHLHNEIGAILDLRKLDQKKLVAKMWVNAPEKGVGALRWSDFVTKFPFGFVAHDGTYENGIHEDFPPVLRLIKILVRYVASYWDGDWWKFAPCDRSGIPKRLTPWLIIVLQSRVGPRPRGLGTVSTENRTGAGTISLIVTPVKLPWRAKPPITCVAPKREHLDGYACAQIGSFLGRLAYVPVELVNSWRKVCG
jgi:hypothetical protein